MKNDIIACFLWGKKEGAWQYSHRSVSLIATILLIVAMYPLKMTWRAYLRYPKWQKLYSHWNNVTNCNNITYCFNAVLSKQYIFRRCNWLLVDIILHCYNWARPVRRYRPVFRLSILWVTKVLFDTLYQKTKMQYLIVIMVLITKVLLICIIFTSSVS